METFWDWRWRRRRWPSLKYDFLLFDIKDKYSLIHDDTIIEYGTYRVTKNDLVWVNEFEYKITLTQFFKLDYPTYMLDSFNYLIRITSNDTIALYEPYADGFSWYFKREGR